MNGKRNRKCVRTSTLVALTVGLWALNTSAQDPNCVREEWELPAGIDPNIVQGYLLPLDITRWAVPCGKFIRVGTCCDEDGDPYDVTFVDGSSVPTVVCSWEEGRWELRVGVLPGINWWVVKVEERPLYSEPKSDLYTVIANGVAPPNTKPVLK